ncbi:MAG: type I methionyl aminopeptidase [Patescibacteria group bacterium]|nr:type I methionyl aminopeptidase [Patescibacteria group bacterium]MDD5554923.1 type I methionyl aminopeptidase [Patescibacteria group bacterium]
MITIKSKQEIRILREGGKILAEILAKIARQAKPGITTADLEKMACDLIGAAGGRPSFKGYQSLLDDKPFPTALCASINDEVVHAPAIPARTLEDGDIIGLDLGMEYPYKKNKNGYYTDMAVTLGVGKIDKEAAELIAVTRESLELAIKKIKPGNTINDIGRTVQQFAESKGFAVVRELVGHGVGYDVHEEPRVPNYEVPEKSPENAVLKPGMVIAVEPMVNRGGWKVKTGPDDFTILTADGSLSAHFEHTIAVTEDEYLVLTEL